MIVLNLLPSVASLCVTTVGPLRGTLTLMHLGALLGFGLIWLASPRLRHQHPLLSVIIFILGFLIAALEG